MNCAALMQMRVCRAGTGCERDDKEFGLDM